MVWIFIRIQLFKRFVLEPWNQNSINAIHNHVIVVVTCMNLEVNILKKIPDLFTFHEKNKQNYFLLFLGANAHFSHSNAGAQLGRLTFDVIIGCDGRRNTFSRYFPRKNRRGKLAIGLTANFLNLRTEEEAQSHEISGISRIYNQKWFKDLQDETDIELENLVYYRDETHYFVMTATKSSLLKRGVLKSDYGDSHQLLCLDNSKFFLEKKF